MKLNPVSRALILASFIGTFGEAMFIPVYPLFTESVGGSLLDIGIGFAIFNMFVGGFVATVGQTEWFEKKVNLALIMAAGIFLVGDLCLLGVKTQLELFAVQAVLGTALGIFNSAWDAMYSEDEESSQAKKWSFWTGGVSFVVGVASLCGPCVVHYLGYKGLFISMAAIDVISIIYAGIASKRWTITIEGETV